MNLKELSQKGLKSLRENKLLQKVIKAIRENETLRNAVKSIRQSLLAQRVGGFVRDRAAERIAVSAVSKVGPQRYLTIAAAALVVLATPLCFYGWVKNSGLALLASLMLCVIAKVFLWIRDKFVQVVAWTLKRGIDLGLNHLDGTTSDTSTVIETTCTRVDDAPKKPE